MQTLEALIARQVNRWNSIAHTLSYQPGERTEPAAKPEGSILHPAICISRDLGAGARAIAGLLCDRIGYELYGTRLIESLALDLRVQRQLIDGMDEAARGTLDMMMDGLLRGQAVDHSDYLRSLARVAAAFGVEGGAVLLGRGTSLILREKAGLRVLIAGSEPVRVMRVMEYQNIGEVEARIIIHKVDRERAAFARQHFKADLRDPAFYDLCINTDRLSPRDAVALILTGLERRGYPLETLQLPKPVAAAGHA
jgi:cytidylate kinase